MSITNLVTSLTSSHSMSIKWQKLAWWLLMIAVIVEAKSRKIMRREWNVMGLNAGLSHVSIMNDQHEFNLFLDLVKSPQIQNHLQNKNDWADNILTYYLMVTTLKLLCVYTPVNSRLFSHQVVSQGNMYYPIITAMPMSPMCEAVFTWLYTISPWKTLWLCSHRLSHWDTGAISQTFPPTHEASRRLSALRFRNLWLSFNN